MNLPREIPAPRDTPSLRELQVTMMHALLDGEADTSAPVTPIHDAPPRDAATRDAVAQLNEHAYIAAHGIPPARRLNVYATTARENFIGSLASSFPAVRRLVGHEYFEHCARSYHRRHPSLSGDLQPAGMQFANHLSAIHGNDAYRYLIDVARLEWFIQESLLAADHPMLDVTRLAAVAPARYDALRFDLHPTVRLFASDYPCLRIWQANTTGDAAPDTIDLSSGGDRLLLMRRDGELVFQQTSSGEQRFLCALMSGARFAEAVEAGEPDNANPAANARATANTDAVVHASVPDGLGGDVFEAAAALRRFVLAGVIVDFH
jgi:hypothetical protein